MAVRKTLQLASLLLVSLAAHAQFLGYVSPQTVQQNLATAVTCTGGTQTFLINNLGQTQHYLQLTGLSGTKTFSAQLVGFDVNGNSYPISDVAMPGTVSSLAVRGTGYWAQIKALITCTTGATFSANYSGGWGTTDVNAGTYLTAQIDKVLWTGLAENVNQGVQLQTPFGSSAGQLAFTYSAGGAGGTITVTCSGSSVLAFQVVVIPLANTTNAQNFQVPDWPCQSITVSYANNGQAGTVNAEFVFAQPGRSTPSWQSAHITGTTATVIKATAPAVLHTVSINTGGAGTFSVFDLAAASCTGTPATNTKAVITATAATLQTFTYDASDFQNGICVKASVAMDVTVTAQ